MRKQSTVRGRLDWAKTPPFEGPLYVRVDDGIARAVRILWGAGIQTYESCEGGPGHSARDPFVRFFGTHGTGYRALGIAMEWGLPVVRLNYSHHVVDGEVDGPFCELVFLKTDALQLPRPNPESSVPDPI